jgi:FkbM family methyltransferase
MKRHDLIIDAGMHRGEDTRLYLAKGFNVVAIEANPDLVAAARREFAGEIATGRLRIMGVAIAAEPGRQRLAVADDITIWSTLSQEFVARNEAQGVRFRHVEVPGVTFQSVLEEVGVPHYLKVDIEGLDMLCVRALRDVPERPDYVSLESSVSVNEASAESVFDELAELWALGYRSFKYVNQQHNARRGSLPRPGRDGHVEGGYSSDSSGPFGEETPGRWQAVDKAYARAQALRAHHNLAGIGGRWAQTRVGRTYRRLRTDVLHRPVAWYDLHARLARPDPRPRRRRR